MEIVSVFNTIDISHSDALNIEEVVDEIHKFNGTKAGTRKLARFGVGYDRPNCLVISSRTIPQRQLDTMARISGLTEYVWEISAKSIIDSTAPVQVSVLHEDADLDTEKITELETLVETISYSTTYDTFVVKPKDFDEKWAILFF